MTKKNLLIIIPARSGSKGIKDKNIKKLKSKPLIYYSIRVAKKIKEKSKTIFCSTDSIKIKNIVQKFNVKVPFLRPKNISKDLSTDITFVNHTLKKFSNLKIFFKTGLILRPTSPIRDLKNIEKAYKLFKKSNSSSLRAICLAPSSPYRMWKLNKNNFIKPLLTTKYYEHYNMPRQELPKIYWQCGNFEFFKIGYKSKIKSISGNNIVGYLLNGKETADIDNIDDFKYVEKLI